MRASLARRGAVVGAALVAAACGFEAAGTRETPSVGGDLDDGGRNLIDASGSQDAGPSDAADAGPCDASTCVVGIAADGDHTCAAIRGKLPRCWGANASGQLGAGLFPDGGEDLLAKPSPHVVATALEALAVTTGDPIVSDHPFSCALAADRTVSCWGSDDRGQRGRSDAGPDAAPPSVPAPASGTTGVFEVQAGGSHVCTRSAAGAVACWGAGESGQLGRPAPVSTFDPTPTAVSLRAPATQISAGGLHTCALFNDESIDCWGGDSAGQLGRGSPVGTSRTPAPVGGLVGASSVSAGYAHTCTVLTGGAVLCWGSDSSGQLGRGSYVAASAAPAFVVLPPGRRATSVAAGMAHSCAVMKDGGVMCWGKNDGGQLGSGVVVGNSITPSQTATPVDVPGVSGAIAVVAGGHHSCALVANGQAVCWGANDVGQLGRGGVPNDVPHPASAPVAF